MPRPEQVPGTPTEFCRIHEGWLGAAFTMGREEPKNCEEDPDEQSRCDEPA